MLWSRKVKTHVPFRDKDWNLVNTSDFIVSQNYPRLTCPNNIYWELLYLNFVLTPGGGVSPFIWLWLQSSDLHFWTIGSIGTVPSGKTYHVCAGQGVEGARGAVNKEVLTIRLPDSCYMRPNDELTIYHIPFNVLTTVLYIKATVKEWRIY